MLQWYILKGQIKKSISTLLEKHFSHVNSFKHSFNNAGIKRFQGREIDFWNIDWWLS